MKHSGFITLIVLLCLSCSKPPERTFSIAINPWPGYEFLYLADQLGLYEEQGLQIKIVQMSSLADVQRAYMNGRVDAMASTVVEAVQAHQLSKRPLKIVLVPDYSKGGDVILARPEIESVMQLKGKNVGCEVGSLGIYVLDRALNKYGLSTDDVNVMNVEQLEGEEKLLSGEIDAMVTYPPISLSIVKHGFQQVFSSAEIPYEIIDVLAVDQEVLEEYPELVPGLHKAWQGALDYTAQHPEKAYAIMVARERISPEEFAETLNDLEVLDFAQQRDIFNKPDNLQMAVLTVCDVLSKVKALESSCASLGDIIYRGALE